MDNSTASPVVLPCHQYLQWCQESFRSGIYSFALSAIIVNTLAALTAVLANGLLFVVYYQNESLRRPANTILLSLALTDFLTGAVVQPIFICEKILILTNCTERICLLRWLRISVMFFLSVETLLNLSLCTLDRYIAVLHSLRYLELVTNERVRNLVLASWFGLICIVITSVLLRYHVVLVTILYISNVALISISYYRIHKEIRRLQNDPVVAANEAEVRRTERERKTAETVGLILGLLFVSYVPAILYLLVSTIAKEVFNTAVTVVLDQKINFIVATFLMMNSTANVFVYYWKNSEFRTAMLKVFRPITQRFRNEVSPA